MAINPQRLAEIMKRMQLSQPAGPAPDGSQMGGAPMPPPDMAPDPGLGAREDGSSKGRGFMGKMKRPNDELESSELSIGVNIDGQDVLIPAMVPTLTKSQLNVLLSLPPKTLPPRDIIQAAIKFAQDRISKGLPPFARVDEEGTYPVPTE